MFKSSNGSLLGLFFIMLMTEIWIFCKIHFFSEIISSGRTHFAIWGIKHYIDPVSKINSRSWVDQFSNMIGYLWKFFQDLCGIPTESHWDY